MPTDTKNYLEKGTQERISYQPHSATFTEFECSYFAFEEQGEFETNICVSRFAQLFLISLESKITSCIEEYSVL